MSVNTKNWKEFILSDLFEFSLAKGDCQISKLPSGDIPLITSGFTNYGIAGYIACGDGISELIRAGTITVDMFGNAFFRDFSYYCVSHGRVIILSPKDTVDKYCSIFLTAIIEKCTKQKYSFANMCCLSNLPHEIIKLPCTNEGDVDYKFMSDYIQSLKNRLVHIADYFLEEGYDRACWYLDNIDQDKFESEFIGSKTNKNLRLNSRKWKDFKFSDIVKDIHNGKSYNKEDLTAVDTDDYVMYVTRSDQNNGISMCVQAMDYDGLEKAGAITIGDTTATAFYQDHDFITGPHIIVVRADWLNVYNALFIIALLNQEKYRYPVFGRAFTKDLIKDTLLRLPIDEDGNPDYKFMEEYIKSLPYSQNI